MSSCRSSTRAYCVWQCFFTVAVLNYICIISNYIPNLRNGVWSCIPVTHLNTCVTMLLWVYFFRWFEGLRPFALVRRALKYVGENSMIFLCFSHIGLYAGLFIVNRLPSALASCTISSTSCLVRLPSCQSCSVQENKAALSVRKIRISTEKPAGRRAFLYMLLHAGVMLPPLAVTLPLSAHMPSAPPLTSSTPPVTATTSPLPSHIVPSTVGDVRRTPLCALFRDCSCP